MFCVSRRYALAAAATGQLSLGAAWAHREICLRVAMNAHAHKRRAHLAVYYDQARRPACARDALPRSLGESARAVWAERTRAGEHDFNAETAAVKFSSWVLRQARSGAQRAGSSRGPRAVQAEDAYDRDENPTWVRAVQRALAEAASKVATTGVSAPGTAGTIVTGRALRGRVAPVGASPSHGAATSAPLRMRARPGSPGRRRAPSRSRAAAPDQAAASSGSRCGARARSLGLPARALCHRNPGEAWA